MNDMTATSGNQVTLASLINKHKSAFASMRDVGGRLRAADEYTKSLIPMNEASAMIGSLGDHLQPCGPDVAGLLAVEFMGAFQKRDMQDPDALKRWLIKEIQDAPRDIAIQAVEKIARSAMYGPKVGEVQKEILELIAKRRDRLAVVESHKREHERRNAEEKERIRTKAEFDENGMRIISQETFDWRVSMHMDVDCFVVR
jgi:hypothetical protein